jgi:hypothetical protein
MKWAIDMYVPPAVNVEGALHSQGWGLSGKSGNPQGQHLQCQLPPEDSAARRSVSTGYSGIAGSRVLARTAAAASIVGSRSTASGTAGRARDR